MFPSVLHPAFVMNIPSHPDTPELSPTTIATELTWRTRPVRTIHENTIIVCIVGNTQKTHVASSWLHSSRFHIFRVLFGKNDIIHLIIRETLGIINILFKGIFRKGISKITEHEMLSPLFRPIYIQIPRQRLVISLVDLIGSPAKIIIIRIRLEFQMIGRIKFIGFRPFLRDPETSRCLQSRLYHPFDIGIIRHVNIFLS